MHFPRIRFIQTILCWIILLLTAKWSFGILRLSELRPEEVAIMQYDSRILEPRTYWHVAYQYNQLYCNTHGHQYIYYALRPEDTCNIRGTELASPWCKVLAMIQASQDFPTVKVFIYMDSDAVVDRRMFNSSLLHLLETMHTRLPDWDPEQRAVVFNQDGPSWWCRLITRVGYTKCLNAGTVLWYRSPASAAVLSNWWEAALDSYDDNPIKRRFRLKWPWEQDRQMAVYHRDAAHIQIASHPAESLMPEAAGLSSWCLSHLPGNGCFISHHCANKASKKLMMKTYGKLVRAAGVSPDAATPARFLLVQPFDINLRAPP